MSKPYLEVTFRNGKPLAAYLYLPRSPGDRSFRTEKASPGMVVDYTKDGKPIGVEITAPTKISATDLNHVLDGLGLPSISDVDVAPLKAA